MMPQKKNLLYIFLASAGGGLLLQLLSPQGGWLTGWFAGSVLLALCAVLLVFSLRWLQADKKCWYLTLISFGARLGLAVFLLWMLPRLGYDTDQQQAGYLFKDAFERDSASWQVVESGDGLLAVFGDEFFQDQYGGMAFVSALVYRVLSPDQHRPYLVLIITSWAFAQGLPFFYAAIKKRWNGQLAWGATLVAALYPDGIFYTAAHMREPLIIGGAMLLFWCLVHLVCGEKRKTALLLALATTIFVSLINVLAGGALLAGMATWWAVENILRTKQKEKQRLQWVLLLVTLAAGTLILLGFGGEWLRYAVWWEMREMMLTSGWVVLIVRDLPQILQYAFITFFGVFQVVLPGAVFDQAAPLWRVMTILRSAGWYLLLPVLAYGFIGVWREKDRAEKIIWLLFLVTSWGWILFSSLRAGGDMWDNPRYRTIFLPWMAVLAVYLWQHRSHWLWRVLAVEGIALLVFTRWYLTRYVFTHWPQVSLALMAMLIAGATVLVVGQGLWYEWTKHRKGTKVPHG